MKLRDENGQSIVEFAMIMPLLLILLLGIIEFSILLYDKAVITNASREGARAGIVAQNPRLTDTDISNIVTNYCANHLINFGNNAVSVSSARTGAAPYTIYDTLTVTVDYDYTFLAFSGLASLLGNPSFGNTIPLDAVTVMRFE